MARRCSRESSRAAVASLHVQDAPTASRWYPISVALLVQAEMVGQSFLSVLPLSYSHPLTRYCTSMTVPTRVISPTAFENNAANVSLESPLVQPAATSIFGLRHRELQGCCMSGSEVSSYLGRSGPLETEMRSRRWRVSVSAISSAGGHACT